MFTQAIYLTAVLVAVVIVAHIMFAVARRACYAAIKPRSGLIEKLVYLALMVAVFDVAASAIVSMLKDGHMLGWALWFHLTAAGALVALLAVAAVFWAEASRFACCKADPSRVERYATFTKIAFWTLLAAGAAAIATILASMFFLNQHSQELAISIHRYAGLALTAAAVLHLYSLIVVRLIRPKA